LVRLFLPLFSIEITKSATAKLTENVSLSRVEQTVSYPNRICRVPYSNGVGITGIKAPCIESPRCTDNTEHGQRARGAAPQYRQPGQGWRCRNPGILRAPSKSWTPASRRAGQRAPMAPPGSWGTAGGSGIRSSPIRRHRHRGDQDRAPPVAPRRLLSGTCVAARSRTRLVAPYFAADRRIWRNCPAPVAASTLLLPLAWPPLPKD
jgi:hypothetical protein